MIQIILQGIVTGLILSVMLGPAFFVLLETSIKKGIRAALAFDMGVLSADVIYILIAYFFIHQVEELSQGEDNAYLRAIGGIIFIAYGAVMFFKKVEDIPVKRDRKGRIRSFKQSIESKDYWIQYIKGFLLNLANPLVVFYWFFVIASGRSGGKASLSGYQLVLFLMLVLFTFFVIDVLKIIGAKQLRPFITGKLLSSLNRITGSILMIFGVFLVINSIMLLVK